MLLGLLLRRQTRQTQRQQFANATGKGEVAARAGPRRPRAFRGAVPTASAASWRYEDPGSAPCGRACSCGGGHDRGNDTTTNLPGSSTRKNLSAVKARRGGKDMMVCEDCGVAICVRCWRAFETQKKDFFGGIFGIFGSIKGCKHSKFET